MRGFGVALAAVALSLAVTPAPLAAAKPFLSRPIGTLCRPAKLTLFSCQLTSGDWISLCLRRAAVGAWKVALVDARTPRGSALSDLSSWNGGFAHGGDMILRGKRGDASVALFIVRGGIPDQSFGAIRTTMHGNAVTRFCRSATVATPSTFKAAPDAPISLWALARAGVAAQSDAAPDGSTWPSEESLSCKGQSVVNPVFPCVRRRHPYHQLPSGRWGSF